MMSGNKDSRKRPRTDSGSDVKPHVGNIGGDELNDRALAPGGDRERHGRFWLDDGSVVLVAGDTAFRVHGSILSRHSAVLRGMIDASKHGSPERMDSCPVLQLSDTAQDLGFFLSALYPDPDIPNFGATLKQLPFADVAARVRLGHKYEVQALVEDGWARIETCFPSSFTSENWDRFTKGKSPVLVTRDDEDAIVVVNLARATGIYSALPMALYQCCTTIENKILLSGFRRGDGVVEKLSTEDLIRCLNAVDYLLNARAISFASLLAIKSPHAECRRPNQCAKIIGSLPAGINEDGNCSTYDALRPFMAKEIDAWGADLCSICFNMVIDKDVEGRKKIFNDLPSHMDVVVDGWGA